MQGCLRPRIHDWKKSRFCSSASIRCSSARGAVYIQLQWQAFSRAAIRNSIWLLSRIRMPGSSADFAQTLMQPLPLLNWCSAVPGLCPVASLEVGACGMVRPPKSINAIRLPSFRWFLAACTQRFDPSWDWTRKPNSDFPLAVWPVGGQDGSRHDCFCRFDSFTPWVRLVWMCAETALWSWWHASSIVSCEICQCGAFNIGGFGHLLEPLPNRQHGSIGPTSESQSGSPTKKALKSTVGATAALLLWTCAAWQDSVKTASDELARLRNLQGQVCNWSFTWEQKWWLLFGSSAHLLWGAAESALLHQAKARIHSYTASDLSRTCFSTWFGPRPFKDIQSLHFLSGSFWLWLKTFQTELGGSPSETEHFTHEKGSRALESCASAAAMQWDSAAVAFMALGAVFQWWVFCLSSFFSPGILWLSVAEQPQPSLWRQWVWPLWLRFYKIWKLHFFLLLCRSWCQNI